ncbi:MAG: ABC transporter ATP-binding protein, partial [Deltaproteobacteria bacterium]|nr:ABC transporter ATP-binding protein [Deltaproteobacteria bacterium]
GAGSRAPSRGTVRVGGRPVRSLSHKERAKLIAFVPQRPESVPDFSVFDVVRMGRYAHRKFLEDYTAGDDLAVLRALEETAVTHLAERSVKTLSGGELQRVYVARAFAQEAGILLLDEAATGLDPAHAAALFDRVRKRNRESGTTVLSAVHDLNLAALYCDRLIFLRHGAVVADGPTRDVFTASVLERVYQAPFYILEHPAAGVPQALALPGKETPHG